MQSGGDSHYNAGRHKRPSPVPVVKNGLITDSILSVNSLNKFNSHSQQNANKKAGLKNLNFPLDFSVSSPKLLSKCDKDICRILGQYFQNLGLK